MQGVTASCGEGVKLGLGGCPGAGDQVLAVGVEVEEFGRTCSAACGREIISAGDAGRAARIVHCLQVVRAALGINRSDNAKKKG